MNVRGIIIAFVSVAALFGEQYCHAQNAAADPAKPLQPPHDFYDTRQCLDCHKSRIGRSSYLGDSSALPWDQDDKHREAFNLLKKQQPLVSQILGFEMQAAFQDPNLKRLKTGNLTAVEAAQVAAVRQCLNCHATWPNVDNTQEPQVPHEQGVSCQACHGPGDSWERPHASPWWRLVTPAAKEKLGFVNVRDPAVRARVCASCHVGDFAAGKFIKHEWYAAGHPPLSSFEYSTYAAWMPAHWQPLSDKPAFEGKDGTDGDFNLGVENRARLRDRNIDIPEAEVRMSFRQANFPNWKPGEPDPFTQLPRLRDALISNTVVLQVYADLLRDYSVAAQDETQKATTPWPEFALYDCAACHHELRSGAGYPNRPFGKNAVGRPPAFVWPTALVNLAVQQAANYDPAAAAARLAKLQQKQTAFERSLTSALFGKRTEIIGAAQELDAELGQLIRELQASPFDQRAANQALLQLTDPTRVETRDYHSARQVAWAFCEIKKDALGIRYNSRPDSPEVASILRDFEFAMGTSAASRDALLLQLPAQRRSVIENLPRFSQAMKEFDHLRFAEQLQKLHAQLSNGK
ncbi:multiheme c-type cytochrome [Anatilimnocola floriformis]|uniref:multiheme c-type cytochrome n=1 Tax=Anatilimnocola floriformis TaxID=2948575 RepID=UPI0020C39492|nr:multiheme c-type cytochrome [Anatilimnocola floriformis]